MLIDELGDTDCDTELLGDTELDGETDALGEILRLSLADGDTD